MKAEPSNISKKLYIQPIVEIISFDYKDIIVASGESCHGNCPPHKGCLSLEDDIIIFNNPFEG